MNRCDMLNKLNGMMTEKLSFREVTQDDFQLIHDIFHDVGSWLHDVKGITGQWGRDMSDEGVQYLINTNETYLACLGTEVVGIVRITEEKTIPWEDADDKGLYVHDLAVKRRFSGMGLGRRILDWAGDMAQRKEKKYLRLDCMAEKPRLRQYYIDAGFDSLGQHPIHTWYALFEKKID